MSVYTVVRRLASDKKTSIRKIEQDLELSNGRLSTWDHHMPAADSLQDVASYLGVTSSFILDEARKEETK
ncbi:transcriptional regulator [Furfurilactobacillus siliginis]|uniref:HTH cro/C1-type domain-containing protein n=1 Tax=Furfurilactobacillus siliginis TaxID=348151 RepID=A0A0R2LE57_9LACO|nr:transcriptional regulator [Furfurilactobacillus siliginis]KRN96823.1 hypothetical protein IV55_GL000688 [Furfurilactobacillus siliginis]GEK28486.1 hypothetical protein LSI01_07970 [Furfurilactobacillus siliginis]